MPTTSVRKAVDSVANSGGRSTRHLLLGLALTTGAVVGSALIAQANAPTDGNPKVKAEYDRLEPSSLQPPKSVFAAVWPPLFLALTVSGLRIWNAPASPARTQALGLWSAVQALNALWMALGPRRLSGQLATALTALAAAIAYAWRAKRVDPPAAGIVAPYVGWISFANVVTGDLWRKNVDKPTIH